MIKSPAVPTPVHYIIDQLSCVHALPLSRGESLFSPELKLACF